MKNVVFISPNFPTNYWQFCRELRNNGLNVLGIGDQPYDDLKPELPLWSSIPFSRRHWAGRMSMQDLLSP